MPPAFLFSAAARWRPVFSAILLFVPRNSLLQSALLVMTANATWLLAQTPTQTPQAPPATPTASTAPPAASVAPQNALRIIVLDPGHGGTDAGARGPGGVLEKDIALVLARVVRGELEKQGYLVVLTREGNDNPSFDDRATLANVQRGALFISLHVSSTGPPNTARAYYFGGTTPAQAESPPASAQSVAPASQPVALVRWEEAQLPHAALSRRFAELLQVQFGLKFRGSSELPSPGAVRQLRSVAAPAVAVEISSVAVDDSKKLTDMAPELAAAILRALESFRPLYEKEGR